MTEIITKVETVTPDQARRFLQNNPRNRNLKEDVVSSIARDILRGDFKITHQGLAFDTDGNVLDGQHRLSAIVKANKPVEMLVTRGLPPETMNVIDIGVKRSQADTLAILGYENASILATAAALYQSFLELEYTVLTRARRKLNNFELQEFIDKHPEIQVSVRAALNNVRLRQSGYPSALAALHCLVTKINKAEANRFFTVMAENFSAERNHPAIVLNEHLLRRKAAGVKVNRLYYIAVFIRAWETFLSKKYTTNFVITDPAVTVKVFLEKNASRRKPAVAASE